jgi:hypothetical protein
MSRSATLNQHRRPTWLHIGQADAEGGKQPEFIEFQLVRGELDLGKDAPETVPKTSEIGCAAVPQKTTRSPGQSTSGSMCAAV